MLDLDNLTTEELEEFIASAEADPKAMAHSHFPDEKGAAVKAINTLIKYAKARIDLLDQTSKNRMDRIKKLEERCNSIYRSIPDYAKF